MGGMTREQWHSAAEKAAAETYGRKYASMYAFRRFGAVPTAVLIGVGVLGWLAYKAWQFLSGAFDGSGPAAPTWSFIAAGALLIATLIAYRPGRMPSMPITGVIKAVVFAGAWIALVSFTVGSMG